MLKKLNAYFHFTKGELVLWISSVTLVTASFFIFDRESFLSLTASLVGVTSLIFCAKGNPIGQMLMIIFSLLYGVISYSFSYYGEMITYLGMTLPMSVISLIAWLRNPFKGMHSVVKIGSIKKYEPIFISIFAIAVTVLFYFILRYFHTANLIPSTLSVATSFIAVYLTSRRIPLFAAAYAANDLVLIVLWSIATFEDVHYASVLTCFVVFFVNDIYGFISWRKMKKIQSAE